MIMPPPTLQFHLAIAAATPDQLRTVLCEFVNKSCEARNLVGARLLPQHVSTSTVQRSERNLASAQAVSNAQEVEASRRDSPANELRQSMAGDHAKSFKAPEWEIWGTEYWDTNNSEDHTDSTEEEEEDI